MTAQDNLQPANTLSTPLTSVAASKKNKKPLTELTERELQRRLNIVWEQKAKVEAKRKILGGQLAKIDKQLKLLEEQEQELDNARHKLTQKKMQKK